jgi:SAM-dependent methyltransferase
MTRLLVPTGARVVAVEPVAEMRAKLAETAPAAAALEGTAEGVPLPNASVDAAVVAQAFHWFEAGRALSELHRVIRPGGGLVLAWNLRDESVRWVARLGELIEASTGSEARRLSTGGRPGSIARASSSRSRRSRSGTRSASRWTASWIEWHR